MIAILIQTRCRFGWGKKVKNQTAKTAVTGEETQTAVLIIDEIPKEVKGEIRIDQINEKIIEKNQTGVLFTGVKGATEGKF